ncbi:beta-lactamase family protein [Dyella sp. LX-66]|uniref:serine hydrolase domain-containing protein n=1 Tax=unclassified Dyella TaxID=2634549 RepID=UPI001BE0295D|nr:MULTISPECIES: serine hydrolase domain-containing protein [unclassified Dyella]MBT2117329.1 beta-lactamase family protein [Dyella sp. LX-1]MBT2138393.1 beta-lactamase family protein [Dyella sp. LX-66]
MFRRGLIVFALMAASVASASDANVAAQARTALEHAVPATDGPGVVVLIAKGDTVLFREARGQAQIELGVPLAADQVFRIASITKIFTAATVLKLAEQGKLSLDDKLAKYFPGIPSADRITLRQLLSHTAGVSDVAKNPQPGFMRRDIDTATQVAEIAKRDPAFEPGTRWAYSNAGYILLGAVIEKVTGQPWHEAMRQLVLEPVGTAQIRYGDGAALIAGRVAGYSTDNPAHRVENASFISSSIPAAAGGLVATADDLMRWIRALAGGRVVSETSFRAMTTPAQPVESPAHRYGLGMYLWRVRDSEMVGHTGQINGFASALAYLPKQDVTVVVLANDDNFDARTMARRLAAIAIGKPYVDPVGVAPSDDMVNALVGQYRIDGKTTETLSVKDGRLYAQRSQHNLVPLQMTADGKLYFVPDELSYFAPVRDAHGKVVRLDYFDGGDNPAQPMPSMAEAVAPTP